MKNWSYLNPGDVIDVIAPASPCPRESLEAGVKWIEDQGYVARVPENIIQGDVFFAAPLKMQLEMMKEAVYSDSKMLWSLRGGYGSMRLIPFMEKWKVPKQTKLFMGFSDVTALHLFFGQRWGWPTIHGKNVSGMTLEKNTADRKEIAKILAGKKEVLEFKSLKPLNDLAKKNARITGKMTGGNLKLLQTSIGTKWELNAKGSILFLEDIGERGYAIDRMLEQLWQAGIIHSGLKALVLGDFIEGEEKNGNDLTGVALKRFAEKSPYPVFKGLKCGHGDINFSLPLHTTAVISGRTLTVPTGGLSL
ncbi:MAG: LD-carboxypeptidase [Bdellovibrionota bacterium]